MSQQAVSLVETGQCRRLSMPVLERILAALEAELELNIRWRGGELDKVIDAGHADLEGSLANLLAADGWLTQLEVTYAMAGDRGSIDLLAFHPETRSLLVGEIKTDVTSADSTLRRHDEKVRLAASIAKQRFGWVAAHVSRLLVLPDSSTTRRRVQRLASLFDWVYPGRGPAVRRWLRDPVGPLAGLTFLASTNAVGDRRDLTSRRRIRKSSQPALQHDARSSGPRQAPRFIDSTGEHQEAL